MTRRQSLCRPPLPARALAAALAFAAAAAQAHDTWFAAGGAALRLGTGNQFPKRETAVGPEYLQRRGCHGPGGTLPLKDGGLEPDALLLQVPPGATGCFLQLTPFSVTLDPALVPLYLREVRPPQAVLDAWAAMQSRGVPWKERYTKHARVALRPGTTPPADPPLGMDALIEADGADGLRVRVLRDGRPLPDFAVEFRHESSPLGIWRRTDAEGRVGFRASLPGAWLLRGIDLRPSSTEPDTWDSRFLTLAFRVDPR